MRWVQQSKCVEIGQTYMARINYRSMVKKGVEFRTCLTSS